MRQPLGLSIAPPKLSREPLNRDMILMRALAADASQGVPGMKRALIIGGGAAGLAAAAELSRRGIASAIVDSADSPGGTANDLSCKGAPQCQRCDACTPGDLRREVISSPLVQVMTGAHVVEVARTPPGFTAVVSSCPLGKCGAPAMEEVEAGAIILAIGHRAFDPRGDPRLHYGECEDVLSSLDVERALSRDGELKVPSTGGRPGNIAIIQCIGSRDLHRGAPYCSKACCKYALKLAKHLRSADPELSITFFHMDWRPYDGGYSELDGFTREKGVRVIRSRPSEVLPGARPAVRYVTPDDGAAEEEFDLVMLSVGLLPPPDAPTLASLLGVEIGPLGFFPSEHDGVFAAGCCTGPKDIRESVEEGIAAAGWAAAYMGEKS